MRSQNNRSEGETAVIFSSLWLPRFLRGVFVLAGRMEARSNGFCKYLFCGGGGAAVEFLIQSIDPTPVMKAIKTDPSKLKDAPVRNPA